MARAKSNNKSAGNKAWAVVRILIGLILLWAFFDKFIGLGYATCSTVDPVTKVESVEVLCDKSALKGGSPTTGFLKFGTSGPLESFYSGLAGNQFVDVLFMSGLLLIGLSLVTGIGVNVAAVTGALLFLMMWTAAFPGDNNPLLDDHIVYAVALIGIMVTNKEQEWGLGRWWQKQDLVKKYPFLA